MKSLKACARVLRAPASDAYLKLFSVSARSEPRRVCVGAMILASAPIFDNRVAKPGHYCDQSTNSGVKIGDKPA